MKEASALIRHNLRKAKGQYLSFGLIIFLTALIINTALVLARQTFPAYDSRFDALQTADINVIIPHMQDYEGLTAELEKMNGIYAAEKHEGVFVTATVREFAGSDFEMNTVFYNMDADRMVNLLDVMDKAADSEHAGDKIYIPMYMEALGGFKVGENITYTIDGKDFIYVIGGIVSEMQYGNYGTGMIGAYMPSTVYRDLAGANEDNVIMEYSVILDGKSDLNHVKKDITKFLNDKGIAALKVSDRDSAKQTRTMVCTLLIAIFLSLAAIILAVSIFLSDYRIRSTIEDELAQMGVLKAIGYTSQLIIISTIMPYVLVGAAASVLGAAVSYAVLPPIANILAVQSGFSYLPGFDMISFLAAVLVPEAAILLFAYVSAGKIHSLEPIDALRGNKGKSGAGQNVLLTAVSFGIMVLLSFAGTLLYNVSIKPDNFMRTLSEEIPSVIFTAENGKLADLKEHLENDGRVNLALEYGTVQVGFADGSLTAFICEDFGKVTNDICYEGHSPANENEIAVGGAIAEDYPIGSKIQVTHNENTGIYTVTGFIQSVNHAGKVCELSKDGYTKIGGSINSVNVYLNSQNADEFIKEYEKRSADMIAASVNYEELSKNSSRMYAGIVSTVVAVLFLLSILLVLLILYVIIGSMISRRRQEYGIYKAIGYTSGQLTLRTAAKFVPIVAAAAFASAMAGILYLPAINGVILSMIGAEKNYFEISVLLLLAATVVFTATSFAISVLLAAPIKKITAYSLLKD